MSILEDLEARGLIHATTDREALARRLASGPITLYFGCDPTSDSLHVGNLIGLLVLRRFQDAGHDVVALAGGATGMVGDPSGRSEERNLLDQATLDANVAAIKAQMARVIDFEGGRARLVDNRDWTADLTLLDFLRDVGKHFTVNQMVARDSVRSRMVGDQGISFTEFSYVLLQANDYLWLNTHLDVEMQIGGSDQWGNIVSGIDLIRRVRGQVAHGLCWPLMTAPDGSKLGKTTGARVWLDGDKTSPYQFFQHWMQTDDRQVRLFLLQLTLLPRPEVERIMAEHEAAPERRQAQRALAGEATRLVHGEAAARAAEDVSRVLFGGELNHVSLDAYELLAREVPVATLPGNTELEVGVDLLSLLVDSGLATSRGDARRTAEQGAVQVNGEKVGADRTITRSDLRHDRYVVIRKGKKSYAVLVTAGARDSSAHS